MIPIRSEPHKKAVLMGLFFLPNIISAVAPFHLGTARAFYTSKAQSFIPIQYACESMRYEIHTLTAVMRPHTIYSIEKHRNDVQEGVNVGRRRRICAWSHIARWYVGVGLRLRTTGTTLIGLRGLLMFWYVVTILAS